MIYINKIINIFLDQFFPERCSHCRERYVGFRNTLCDVCLSNIRKISIKNRCKKCGEKLDDGCISCSKKKLLFKSSFFLWSYKKEARNLLKLAKFKERKNAFRYLSNCIKNLNEMDLSHLKLNSDTVILPVTSSRPFIYKMSGILAKILSLPLLKPYKKSSSRIQSKLLHEKDRYLQIENTLQLKSNFVPLLKKYSNFIIVDDIWTTGATLNYAAKLLVDQNIEPENIQVMAFFRRDKHIYR